jgi:hypothetical protein
MVKCKAKTQQQLHLRFEKNILRFLFVFKTQFRNVMLEVIMTVLIWKKYLKTFKFCI